MRLRAVKLVIFSALLVGLAAAPTSASPITSLPSGSGVLMPGVDYFGLGPQVFSGITWTSNDSSSVFGYTGGYGFSTNGFWSGALGPMAGSNDPFATMTFTFASPVTGVGGFLSWAPNTGATPTIAIYDSSNNLLGSTVLSFLTSGGQDTGEFHGFLMNSAAISSFTLTGSYIGITDLTVDATAAPVPEPATLLLLGTGLSAIAARRRMKNRT